MSIPSQIINYDTEPLENTVYFYPGKLKISYSSLEILKDYLKQIFDQDIRLEEKLRQCNTFFNTIIRELILAGVLKEDHTLVISDPVVKKPIFLNAIKPAFEKTINSKITFTKPSKINITKRKLLTAIFIKKEEPYRYFFSILRAKGEVNSSILNFNIDLEKHAQIRFQAGRELEEYIVNILTRTALLSQGCSIFTLRLYIEIIIELVIWYSRGLAMIENQQEVTPGILSSSIKLVDNYYITDPNFIKMLQGVFIGKLIKILN